MRERRREGESEIICDLPMDFPISNIISFERGRGREGEREKGREVLWER